MKIFGRIALVAVVGLATAPAFAATYLYETFPYASGPLRTSSSNVWITHSGTANQQDVDATASDNGNSLSPTGTTGYTASSGNRVNLTGTESEDASTSLSVSNIGTTGTVVYWSALVKQTAQANATGEYFAHLQGLGSTSAFYARLYTRSSGAGFQFGVSYSSISGGADPAQYETTVRNFNQTYLVVVKTQFIAGPKNDVSQIFVSPASATSEPGGADATWTNNSTNTNNPLDIHDVTSGAQSIANFGLRQATNIGTLQIDEIRVGDTYSGAVAKVGNWQTY